MRTWTNSNNLLLESTCNQHKPHPSLIIRRDLVQRSPQTEPEWRMCTFSRASKRRTPPTHPPPTPPHAPASSAFRGEERAHHPCGSEWETPHFRSKRVSAAARRKRQLAQIFPQAVSRYIIITGRRNNKAEEVCFGKQGKWVYCTWPSGCVWDGEKSNQGSPLSRAP